MQRKYQIVLKTLCCYIATLLSVFRWACFIFQGSRTTMWHWAITVGNFLFFSMGCHKTDIAWINSILFNGPFRFIGFFTTEPQMLYVVNFWTMNNHFNLCMTFSVCISVWYDKELNSSGKEMATWNLENIDDRRWNIWL